MQAIHCVKSVRIRIFSGPYFPAFGLNMETYSVSILIQSECGKIQTRKTLNTDTFYAVVIKRTGSVELHNNRFKVTKFLFNIPTLYPIKTPENPVIICQKWVNLASWRHEFCGIHTVVTKFFVGSTTYYAGLRTKQKQPFEGVL